MPTLESPDARMPSGASRLPNSWASNQHLEAAASAESRDASSYVDERLNRSIQDSSFLSTEKHFSNLYLRLYTLRSVDLDAGASSVARVDLILKQLRKLSLAPSQLVSLTDEPGVGLTFYEGSRRAELEVLYDGGCFLTMYDREGPIIVTEPELERDVISTVMRILDFLAA